MRPELSTREFAMEMLNQLDREVEIINEGSDYAATLQEKDATLVLKIFLKDSNKPFVETSFILDMPDRASEIALADQLESTYVMLSNLNQKRGT